MNTTLKNILSLSLIIASAYISVTLPISAQGIPFTAQSLVIFIVAALLRPMDFLLVISLYLLAGAAGLPVYADGESGLGKLFGASGGFLFGFLFSGLCISTSLSDKNRSFGGVLGTMILATAILFFFGLGMLAYKFGFAKALEYGFYPFWAMALVKALLATFCVFGVSMRSRKA